MEELTKLYKSFGDDQYLGTGHNLEASNTVFGNAQYGSVEAFIPKPVPVPAGGVITVFVD